MDRCNGTSVFVLSDIWIDLFSGPAPGNRHRAYGTLCYIGNDGYSWSSSIADSDAYFLYFYSDRVTPQHMANRADGFQVRCLQE